MKPEAISDQKGKDTLEIISEADNFNHWMFETILPFTKGKILEVGSGLGNISSFFLQQGCEIMLTDFRTEYCLALKDKFKSFPNLIGVNNIDLVHPDFKKVYSGYLRSFDTVFALNVIEHIEDDNLAINNCKKLLKQNGNLIILVPAYNGLYNKFDEELGHFRRYTRKSLSEILIKNNFEVLHTQYFNFIGMLGWFLSGKVLKKDMIPANQMKLYNRMVRAWKIIDRLTINRIGLSTIVIGKNKLD